MHKSININIDYTIMNWSCYVCRKNFHRFYLQDSYFFVIKMLLLSFKMPIPYEA